MTAADDVTDLLQNWRDPTAKARLVSLIYDELRGLASRQLLRERRHHTLRPTALVHEAYLRLAEQTRMRWRDRAHFLAIAAQMMRRILVDHARRRGALKRGGGAACFVLDEARDLADVEGIDLVALDDAMTALAELDARQARVVELRFFGGLSVRDTGAVLGISPATVKRDWASAKAWLYHQLRPSVSDSS
ncbi:MAG: sigma-70 family RNA polymerase sigma factor [Thermoanaerobaculia bacterium]|nr:sigma-70 family RNA polymerase sigma factor [Thermoanaerobaculia bacterium]